MTATTNVRESREMNIEFPAGEDYLRQEALSRARTLALARRLGRRAERTALRTRLGLARRL